MATPCAERAYATLAPYYDAFTRHHQHDLWLERLEGLAREHGSPGAATFVVEQPGLFPCWEGRGCGAAPGEPGSAEISIFERAGGAWRRQADADESGHTKLVHLARRA
jgi:hypothetical protein